MGSELITVDRAAQKDRLTYPQVFIPTDEELQTIFRYLPIGQVSPPSRWSLHYSEGLFPSSYENYEGRNPNLFIYLRT